MRQLTLALIFLLPACTTNAPPPDVAEADCLDRTHTAAAEDFRDYAEMQQRDGYVTEITRSNYTNVYDRECR